MQGDSEEEEGCAHITGQSLIVLHQLLVLLVDRQHFADPVGRRLGLDGEGRESVRPQAGGPTPFPLDKYSAGRPTSHSNVTRALRFQEASA